SAVRCQSRGRLKTRSDLENERQHYRDRVTHLELLRDNIVAGEIYALNRTDLRLSELISPDFAIASDSSDEEPVIERTNVAVDGLKLTIPGEQLRTMLQQRVDDHRERAASWRREQARAGPA